MGESSTRKQNLRSPDQQFDTIEHVRQRLGYSQWQHVATYRDDGISGRLVRQRPEFMRMLEDIRTERVVVDAVLVDTVERFGRNDELDAIRCELYLDHGVVVLAANNGFLDPTSTEGEAVAFAESMRACAHRLVLAHDINRGKVDKVKARFWPGGPVPAGFILSDRQEQGGVHGRRLVPDEKTQWVIQRMFELAYRTGDGTPRLAQACNNDPQMRRAWGRGFHANTIGRILDDELYKGVLRYNQVTVDIVRDQRRTYRNDPEEMYVIEAFCPPLVSDKLWNNVQRLRQRRRDAMAAVHNKSGGKSGKQIAALAPGVRLVYPLRGLVCCGVCGAAMSFRRSGKRANRRVYVGCPRRHDGDCTNKHMVREQDLWQAVIGNVRKRLLPPPDEHDQAPPWLPQLVAQVHQVLQRHEQDQESGKAAALRREAEQLEKQCTGYEQSLGNPELDREVRRDLEARYGQMQQRLKAVHAEINEIEHRYRRADELLNPDRVLEQLHQLEEVLGETNPTLLNDVLARHIDRIDVHADGQIIMRTCKLGCFDGLVMLLSDTPPSGDNKQMPPDANGERIRPRRRPRRNLSGLKPYGSKDGGSPLLFRPDDPQRFAHLADQWFWNDPLPIQTGRRPCWAAEHAQEVLKMTTQHPVWNQNKLAKHFGVSRPTIRHALRIANGEDNPRQPRKPKPHGPRAADIAEQAYQLYNVEGKKIAEIGTILGVSRNTASQALDLAYAQRGEKRPDGRKVAGKRRVKPAHEKKAAKLEPQVMELFHAKWEYGEIANELNTHRDMVTRIVRNWHRRHGKTPPDGRSRRQYLPRKSRSKKSTTPRKDQAQRTQAEEDRAA